MEASSKSKENRPRVLALAAPAGRPAELPSQLSESSARLLGAVGVAAIAVVHILDSVGTYESTRWIFWAYIAVIAAAIPVALTLTHWASPLAWIATAGLAAGPFVGYLWSRTLGLPGDQPDVGNWLCTLGMASLFVEASVIALSATRVGLRGPWRQAT
jgi:hypothetical protein